MQILPGLPIIVPGLKILTVTRPFIQEQAEDHNLPGLILETPEIQDRILLKERRDLAVTGLTDLNLPEEALIQDPQEVTGAAEALLQPPEVVVAVAGLPEPEVLAADLPEVAVVEEDNLH